MKQLLPTILSFAMITIALFALLFIVAAWQNDASEPLLGLIPAAIAFLLLLKGYWQVKEAK